MGITRKIKLALLLGLILPVLGCAEFKGIFDETARTSYSPAPSRPVPEKINRADVREGLVSEMRAPIVTREGTYYFVQSGDTLAQIAHKYRLDWEAIAQINSLGEDQLVVGRRLFIPHKKNLEKFGVVSRTISTTRGKASKTAVAKAAKSSRASKKFQFFWPVDGGRVTSRFGSRWGRPHDGIDIAATPGTAVLAAEAGKVIFAKRFAGYGNLIVVTHKEDYFTAYAHNQDVFVRKGQKVKRGQRIAVVGRTGRATGPHLHFEVRQGTQSVDPLQFFPDKR